MPNDEHHSPDAPAVVTKGGTQSKLPRWLKWLAWIVSLPLCCLAVLAAIWIKVEYIRISRSVTFEWSGPPSEVDRAGIRINYSIDLTYTNGGSIHTYPIRADFPGSTILQLPQPVRGECKLIFEWQDLRFSFPFEKKEAGKRFVATPGRWMLTRAAVRTADLKTLRSKSVPGNIEPSGLRRGESIVIRRSDGKDVAEATALSDLTEVYVPNSSAGAFKYAIKRSLGPTPSTSRVERDASYLMNYDILLMHLPKGDLSSLRCVDELNRQELNDKGRLLTVSDTFTGEATELRFEPQASLSTAEYHGTSYNPQESSRTIQFRPAVLKCERLWFIDEITSNQLDNVGITSPDAGTYDSRTRQWFLPRPEQAKDYQSLKLQFNLWGYQPIALGATNISKLLNQERVNPIALARTHTNIIVVWPTSPAMARTLGSQAIARGKALLTALLHELHISALDPRIRTNVTLLLLRSDGLQEMPQDLGSLAYKDADNILAVTPRQRDGRYRIFDDPKHSQRFGRHTIVVICIPTELTLPDPSTLSARGLQLPDHIHAVGIAPAGSQEPGNYVTPYFNSLFSSHSIIVAEGDGEGPSGAKTRAKTVVADLVKAVREEVKLQKNQMEKSK